MTLLEDRHVVRQSRNELRVMGGNHDSYAGPEILSYPFDERLTPTDVQMLLRLVEEENLARSSQRRTQRYQLHQPC